MSSVLTISDFVSLIDGIDESSELASASWKQFHELVLNVEKVVLARVESAKAPIKQKDSVTFESLLHDYGIFRSRLDALHKEYQGKAMSDQVYNEFTGLRDFAVPELREKLLAEFLKD